jgi:two-component system CheB/CheR fusion protein
VAAPGAAPRTGVKPRASALPQRGSVLHLERELAASREYLQSIIQELEAANEEMQSANEEILSSNEELQSTNEELNTLNEELHSSNEELSRVNSDLINLLASVQIAIVIVNADLRIRRFTPMAEKVFNLIPTDVDRSIAHINPNVECPGLERLIVECIDTISLVEREVQDRQGRWYALRIRPYRSVDNKIDGAVVLLFDIDVPKRFEAAARMVSDFAEGVLQTAAQPMAVVDSQLLVRSANRPFQALCTAPGGGVHGRALGELGVGVDGLERLKTLAARGEDNQPDAITLPVAHPEMPGATLTARAFPSNESPSDRLLLLSLNPGSAEAYAG